MDFNKATILADSITESGRRLVSVEAKYPRIVHSEVMTHRQLSRGSGSSRAIPGAKMRMSVIEEPFIPDEWGTLQSGMQAGAPLPPEIAAKARDIWLRMRDQMVEGSRLLEELGVHKQLSNRPLETFQYIRVIITATDWRNFFALRVHPDAQPQFQRIARLIRDAMDASTPRVVGPGDWHRPLVPDLAELTQAYDTDTVNRIAIGRCARVSYYTHDGKRDPAKDLELCDGLTRDGHMSPLEHVATPADDPNAYYGNFVGWLQYRKTIPNEHDFSLRTSA